MTSPRTRLADALRHDADLHERMRTAEIGGAYDDVEAELLPVDDGRDPAVAIAFRFWDGWIDARNHDWRSYEGIGRDDWPALARQLAGHLEGDRAPLDPRVVSHFAPSSRVPLLRRVRAWFGW